MAGLANFRMQHPEYSDMPDGALSDKLYQKFYSDMPRDQFDAKMGAVPAQQQQASDGTMSGDATSALAKTPGWQYRSILPFANDPAGHSHWALPDIVREPLQSAFGSAHKLDQGQVPTVEDVMPSVLSLVGSGIKAPTGGAAGAAAAFRAITASGPPPPPPSAAAAAALRAAPAPPAAAPPQVSRADALAAATIKKFAGGEPSLDARQIVPGSSPTMAEAATDGGNLGISSLQRTVSNFSPNGPLAQSGVANAQARTDFLSKLVGTSGDLESAKLARDALTGPMRKDAFAKAIGPADSSGVDGIIGRILSGPAGQRDVVANTLQDIRAKLQVDNPLASRVSDAMGPIQAELSKAGISQARRADLMEARRLLGSASRGYTQEDELTAALSKLAAKQKIVGPIDNALSVIKSGDTAFESDPEQLYGIRQSITDRLSPLARGTANDARVAASKLQPVMKALDEAIEGAAPGYKDYMAKFSELSKPIDQMDYLQSLNLVDQRGNTTLAKVQNALRNITQQRAEGGVNQAKSLTDDHIAQLESLRDDLMAANNISQGRAVGSNTVQNIASQHALQSVLPGKIGAFAGRYVRPEVAGGAIGGTLGSLLGPGGTVAGAGIGTGIGNVISRGMEAKNADVLKSLEEMLANPQHYQTVVKALARWNDRPPNDFATRAVNNLLNAGRK